MYFIHFSVEKWGKFAAFNVNNFVDNFHFNCSKKEKMLKNGCLGEHAPVFVEKIVDFHEKRLHFGKVWGKMLIMWITLFTELTPLKSL